MKSLMAVLVLSFAATACYGADKITYSTAELQVMGNDNVPDIVERFVEDTDSDTPIEPERMMFLVDGEAVASLDAYLPDSDRVEVMSDGTYVIINVITQPEDE